MVKQFASCQFQKILNIPFAVFQNSKHKKIILFARQLLKNRHEN